MRIDMRKMVDNEEVDMVDTTRSEISRLSKKADDDDLSRLKNWQTVKDLEKMNAPKEIIDKYRTKAGVISGPGQSSNSNVNQMQQMLAMKITNAETSQQKAELLNMSNMLTNDSGQVNNPAFMAALMGNESRKTKTEEVLMTKVLDKMLDQATKAPEKVDELAMFDKMMTVFEKVQKMQTPPDTVDEWLKNIELAKKMGMVKDVSEQDSVEKMKIDLERTKIEKDFDLEKMKEENSATKYSNISNELGGVIGSVASAWIASQEGQEVNTSVTERIKNSAESSNGYKAICQKCNKQMMITDVKTSRTIACPNCDQQYDFDGSNSKLYMVNANAPITPPGPEETQKPGSSPTNQL